MSVGGCRICSGPVSRCSRSGLCRVCYLRPLPADFTARAALMRQSELIKHYGVAESTVARWYKETGLSTPGRFYFAPDDLAEKAATMGVMQLRRHYGRAERVIRRWLNEAGLKALQSPPRPRSDYKPRAPRKLPSRPIYWKGPPQAGIPGRDTSIVGTAAEHLRRLAPVHRCDERGKVPDCRDRLTHWRYGTAVLTEDELLQRARRHGWEAIA